jgi:hypothetical protein
MCGQLYIYLTVKSARSTYFIYDFKLSQLPAIKKSTVFPDFAMKIETVTQRALIVTARGATFSKNQLPYQV